MDSHPASLQTFSPIEASTHASNGSAQSNSSFRLSTQTEPGVVQAVVQEKATAGKHDILQKILSGNLWVVSERRRNGLILLKQFHAEFAGPGAAVGGVFDEDCSQVIPVGDLTLLTPTNHQERQKAYLIRRQWIRLTQQFTDNSQPLQRAQMILNQFETYFDAETVARVPDESFALLVGVLPNSIRMARRTPGILNVKVKA